MASNASKEFKKLPSKKSQLSTFIRCVFVRKPCMSHASESNIFDVNTAARHGL